MSESRTVIDRTGAVYFSTDGTMPATLRGWVDKYRPTSSRLPWRGVKQGGREKFGFPTRKQAAEWVVKP